MQRATTANQHSCHTNLKADRVVKRAAAGSVNEASAAGRAVHFPQESTWQTGTVVCTCMLCKISKAFLIQSAIAVLLLVTYFSYFPFSSHSVREIWSVLGFKCMKVRFSAVTGRVCVLGLLDFIIENVMMVDPKTANTFWARVLMSVKFSSLRVKTPKWKTVCDSATS